MAQLSFITIQADGSPIRILCMLVCYSDPDAKHKIGAESLKTPKQIYIHTSKTFLFVVVSCLKCLRGNQTIKSIVRLSFVKLEKNLSGKVA